MTATPQNDSASSDIDRRIRELPVAAQMADGTLVLEIDMSGSEGDLWESLTDPERLAQWSPVVPDRPLTSVGPALSREQPDQDPVACDVIAVAGSHALTHRWGDEQLGWLIEQGRLVVQMALSEPEHAPLFAAGWHVCLGVLDAQLAGVPQERIVGMDAMDHGWEELRRRYVDELDCPDLPLS